MCKSCRTCFKFCCMFYFTCDRSLSIEFVLAASQPPCRTRDVLQDYCLMLAMYRTCRSCCPPHKTIFITTKLRRNLVSPTTAIHISAVFERFDSNLLGCMCIKISSTVIYKFSTDNNKQLLLCHRYIDISVRSHYFFVLGRMLVVVLNPLCPVRFSLLLYCIYFCFFIPNKTISISISNFTTFLMPRNEV